VTNNLLESVRNVVATPEEQRFHALFVESRERLHS